MPLIHNWRKNYKHKLIRYVINSMTALNENIQATLTGSDGPVSGTAKSINYSGFSKAYEFLSTDETLHLIIALNDSGKWVRVAGTDPYLSGWIGELAEQI